MINFGRFSGIGPKGDDWRFASAHILQVARRQQAQAFCDDEVPQNRLVDHFSVRLRQNGGFQQCGGSLAPPTLTKPVDDLQQPVVACPGVTGGSLKTIEFAQKHKKPYLHVHLDTQDKVIRAFIDTHRPKLLNIAGSRESKEPGVYGWSWRCWSESCLDVIALPRLCLAMIKTLLTWTILFVVSITVNAAPPKTDDLSPEVLALQGVWAPVNEADEPGIHCRMVVHGRYFLIFHPSNYGTSVREVRGFTADGQWIRDAKGEKVMEYMAAEDGSSFSFENTRKSEIELKRVGNLPNLNIKKPAKK